MKIRALTDIPGTDIKAGEFFDCPDKKAAELVDGGIADDKATEADVYGSDIPPAKVLEEATTDGKAAEATQKSKK